LSAQDCSDGMQTFGKIIREKKFPHLMMVEASAGSGKTEALARRYVWLVLAGESRVPHGDISSILAITFTRKAAREMKERVLDLLKRHKAGRFAGAGHSDDR
jgi:ATP-dependent helicase/nuclease subunit A